MNIHKSLRSTVTAAFCLAGLSGLISAQAAALDPVVDCTPGGLYEPILDPNAVVRTDVDGICLLCGVEDALAVVDRKRSTYATLRTAVGVASNVSLTVTDSSTRYAASSVKPKGAGFVVRSADKVLSLDLLRGATVTTSLNGVDRQSFSVGGPLKLDLLGLLNSQDYFVLGGAATKDFDAVRITFGSAVRALTSLRVYGACVRNN